MQAVTHSTWPTPTVADVEGGRKHRSGARSGELLLNGLAATWPTPTVGDSMSARNATARRLNPDSKHHTGTTLMDAADPIGPSMNGAQAPTEKRGALNPEFVFWLMGFPDAWVSSALVAMQSLPRSRRKSSPR